MTCERSTFTKPRLICRNCWCGWLKGRRSSSLAQGSLLRDSSRSSPYLAELWGRMKVFLKFLTTSTRLCRTTCRPTSRRENPSRYALLALDAGRTRAFVPSLSGSPARSGKRAFPVVGQLLGDRDQVLDRQAAASDATVGVRAESDGDERHFGSSSPPCACASRGDIASASWRSLRPSPDRTGPTRRAQYSYRRPAVCSLRSRDSLGLITLGSARR